MKKVISLSIFSSAIIAASVWIASILFTFSYNEWSFLIGLGLSIIIFFFSSSGGATSRGAMFEASQSMWKVQNENNDIKANAGVVFYGAVLYTIISLIVTIVLYY